MGSELKIGFLGAGKMASALAKGFVKAGLCKAGNICASDPSEAARTAFQREAGKESRVTQSNEEVARFAQVLILAVKPDYVPPVLKEIQQTFSADHLLISIAAGVPISKMETELGGSGRRVIRVMPNTPALLGDSASAYAPGKHATDADLELTQRLLSSVGKAFKLKESLLDAVTGLSGSGPAYVYLFIEGLSDGGVAAGLPRDVATQLAAQTVLGAARMVLETGMHPGALKDMVTSPGGTTIEGLHELEKGKLRGTLISAVRAASDKSRRLGQG